METIEMAIVYKLFYENTKSEYLHYLAVKETEVEFYDNEGYVRHTTMQLNFPSVDIEDAKRAMVAALTKQQSTIKAKAQAEVTEIQARINRLLSLEFVPAAEDKGSFAPRRTPDITDVEEL